MIDRSDYLQNNDDQISSQKRMEQAGTGVVAAIATVGAVAGFIIAGKKIALSRAFSGEIKQIGRAGENYSRYLLSEVAGAKNPLKKIMGTLEALRAPIPTGAEQLKIAVERLGKAGIDFRGAGWAEMLNAARSHSKINTLLRGPFAAAIAPRAPIVGIGKRFSSGKYGAIAAGGNIVRLDKSGNIASTLMGVDIGIAGSPGSRMEFLRTHDIKKMNLRTFTRNTIAPMKRDIFLEQKRHMLEEYLLSKNVVPSSFANEPTTGALIGKLSEQLDSVANQVGADKSWKFFKDRKVDLQDAYHSSLNQIVDTEMAKPYAKRAHQIYSAQIRAGIGEPYAGYNQGFFQKQWTSLRNDLDMTIKDPLTGRAYQARPRRFIGEGKSISGMWEHGVKGSFYAFPKGGAVKREALNLLEGTFFGQLEGVFGVGISSSPSRMTDFISKTLGAQKGSYGEFAIRRYLGGFGRIAAIGVGGALTFKLVNYMAKQTTGWGVTDVAGKMYTTGREFQQHVLTMLNITQSAKRLEKAFPGSVKSPAMTIARLASPIWMMKLGKGLGGKSGALTGLALGIATALLTWGDITQSPEELHRIYTGEQDIPVKKGRYWMFGKTPFGGGKTSYWRPHWYPLLRSRYKYKGQLWDSETEELAQGSVLSPVLAPLLQGRMWDPYYWEKKHYKDRPYPVTGELFEPTMPFAWLGNATIANLIKPQRPMHTEYSGVPQGEAGTSRTIAAGAGAQMGMGGANNLPMLPNVNPSSVGWLAGEGMYTLSEQMGIRGFLFNTMSENITGREDFLPAGPIAQSARRATGYERAYWDLEMGDPGNVTEFARRILPHRRRGIEEYNPIANTMPNWLPGSDYFMNFRTGDPYTKVEMGEARLPGAAYEELHRLHSGVPGVYDAMDRFLILSDIAPYSKEYTQYKYMAQSMTRKDPYWSEIFKKHISQREKTREEYEFLDLTPPEDVTGIARPLSKIYRNVLASVTGAGGLVEPALSYAALGGLAGGGGGAGMFAMAFSPISKFMPYKTARQTYKDYRLQGSDFTDWSHPMRDFVKPYINKAIDFGTSRFGVDYVPPEEQKRREYADYFDKLQYIKFKKLEAQATAAGNAKLASRFSMMSSKTLTGVDPYAEESRMMPAIPKRERSFVNAFIEANPADRESIRQMVSPEMAKVYEAQWGMRDGEGRGRVTDEQQISDAVSYFSHGNLPEENWSGWNPDVDVKDTQIKVIRNEGMNIHNFDLWESQERSMARRPYVSSLGGIGNQPGDISKLKQLLHAQLMNDGYTNVNSYATNTPASSNTVRLNIKVKRDQSKSHFQHVRSAMNG